MTQSYSPRKILSTIMGSSAKGGPNRTRVILALIAAILFIVSTVMVLAGADPVLVFASWLMGETMTLAFGIFELAAIAFSVAVVHMVSSDGESNWYEGLMLLVVYAIMAVGFWFYG